MIADELNGDEKNSAKTVPRISQYNNRMHGYVLVLIC
jgi:hypothetical protein